MHRCRRRRDRTDLPVDVPDIAIVQIAISAALAVALAELAAGHNVTGRKED